MAPRRWVTLTDMNGSARIMSLDEDEDQRDVVPAQIADNALSVGLRRMILEETTDETHFRETGEFAPITPELHLMMLLAHKARNNWNFDWPHLAVESDTSAEPVLREKLAAMMAPHPFDFKLTGLQRRQLLYFSDGNVATQKLFAGVAPRPTRYPFTTKGVLAKWACGSLGTWGSTERDKGATAPAGAVGNPLLYYGPAWAVRFMLDGQVPLHGNCIMYVDDNGEFLCSDWCQRHDYSSYGGGINLQLGVYTFDSWIMGPCLSNAMQHRVFTPKNVKVERTPVRELAEQSRQAVLVAKERVRLQYEKFSTVNVGRKDLTKRVRASLAAAPEMECEAHTAQIVGQLCASFKARNMAEALGAIVWVRSEYFHGNTSALVVKNADFRYYQYQLVDTCSSRPLAPGIICFQPNGVGGGDHKHFGSTEIGAGYIQFDEEATTKAVAAILDSELQKQEPNTAGPITAEVMAMALAAFQGHQKPVPAPTTLERHKGVGVGAEAFVYMGQLWYAQLKPGFVEFSRPAITGQAVVVGCVIRRNNGHLYRIDPETQVTSIINDATFKAAAAFYFETF